MSNVNWTKEQQEAIYEKDSNILVAAAAGSGKTAVLVERIINKILEEKIDIDTLLVVTFTNAAASEMRERILDAIYKKIEKNPENERLQRQINLLNKASICTIDAFCLEIVRNNFYEIENISPNFRIADNTEIELIKLEVIEEVFETKYETENLDFVKLINTYTSYRDDQPLKDLVIKIYSYIQSNPFPNEWLNEKIELFNVSEKIEKDFSNTIWGKIILKEIEEELQDSILILKKLEEKLNYEPELEKFSQTIRDDIEKIEDLKYNLKNWDSSYNINQNFKFNDWPRKKIESEIKEEAKTIRDDVKKRVKKIVDRTLIYTSKEANQDISDMYGILSKLKELIFEFQNEFSKKKREKNIVDFNDISHFALSLLLKKNEDGIIEKTEIAKKYQNKYMEIAIDEYQDSNLVQEYILTAVGKENNIFMVGDVKQSIYKFRQAMPELFLSKYADYKFKDESNELNENNEKGIKIQLFKNFRSKKNILDFTNIIFENIMSSIIGDIDYNFEEYLNLGANYEEIEQDEKIEINILNVKEIEKDKKIESKENFYDEQTLENEEEDDNNEERIENIELEARFTTNKIQKLIKNKFQVWDKKLKKYRDIQYKDIVILLRATSISSPIYEQEILKLDIPVFSDASQEYLDSLEIQTVISLLKIIDNPLQDIPLVTVLRSNIGKFTDDELVQIRLTDKQDNFYTCMQKALVIADFELKEKIKKFFNNILKWRKEQEYLALDELIWKIYSDTGYYNYVGLMPNGAQRQANLKMLFEKSKKYETANFKGLYNFIKFIEAIKLSTGDMSAAKIIGENDNVIRIMSIHKSKGLEFPVVFLSNTGKQFNLRDLNDNILLHQEIGIGVKYIDYEKQIQYSTLTREALKNKILIETLSEEMRVLYVALTRAKEKLIITGVEKDYEDKLKKMQQQVDIYEKNNNKINPILIKKYKKYLDWILLIYLYNIDNAKNIANLNVYNKKDIMKSFDTIEKKDIDIIEKFEKFKVSEDEIKEIEKLFEFKYKNELETKIPAKIAVSEVKRLEQERQQEDIHLETFEKLNNKSNLETQNIDNSKINSKIKEFTVPKFIKKEENIKLSASQKGTLIHLCIQNLDIKEKYNLEKIQRLILKLVEKEIITLNESENINPNILLKFTESNLWSELINAKEIYKEKPFYIMLSSEEIYNNKSEEDIIVQGIIDLYFINKQNKLILVDYKTDYVEEGKEKELINKYKKQLEIYKKALEEGLSRKVDEVIIYSTYLQKEIYIN